MVVITTTTSTASKMTATAMQKCDPLSSADASAKLKKRPWKVLLLFTMQLPYMCQQQISPLNVTYAK